MNYDKVSFFNHSQDRLIAKPFDKEKHEKALHAGLLLWHQEPSKKCLHVDKREAHQRGNGFGTAAMRYLVEQSYKLGYEGNIDSETSWSSHLFHLYMGMIPKEKDEKFVSYAWGDFGEDVLKNLEDNYYHDDKTALEEDLEVLSEMLHMVKNFKEYSTLTETDILKFKNLKEDELFTEADILDEKNMELILSLRQKTLSHLRFKFIPLLLRTLQKNTNIKYPDTGTWGSIVMVLSNAGKARWKEALDKNIEFVPFKNFEHLYPFMTSDQKQLLNEIVKKRSMQLATPDTSHHVQLR